MPANVLLQTLMQQHYWPLLTFWPWLTTSLKNTICSMNFSPLMAVIFNLVVFVQHSSNRSKERINVLSIAGGIINTELYHWKRCLQIVSSFLFLNFILQKNIILSVWEENKRLLFLILNHHNFQTKL